MVYLDIYQLKYILVVYPFGQFIKKAIITTHRFVCEHKFLFLFSKYREVELLSHVGSICLTCQAVFQSDCTILLSHQQHENSVASNPHHHGIFSFLVSVFNFSHSNRYIVVLICMYLVTNCIEHLLMCLFATQMPSLVKYMLKSFAHFCTGFFSYYWILRVTYMLHIYIYLYPLSDNCLVNIFSQAGLLFYFLSVIFK